MNFFIVFLVNNDFQDNENKDDKEKIDLFLKYLFPLNLVCQTLLIIVALGLIF